MTDVTLAPVPKSNRGLRIALAVSLALNLGVAGMAGGMYLRGGPPPHGDQVRDMGFGPFDGALRPEDRAALRKSMVGHVGDLRAARREMQADATAILAALRASPFDAAVLTTALAAQQQHLAARLTLGSGVIRDFLVGLPEQDRLGFADRLEARMHRGRGPDGTGPDEAPAN
ncbi:MAG: periplasmic heavy metal sensor [Paracoccaceae bacterium]